MASQVTASMVTVAIGNFTTIRIDQSGAIVRRPDDDVIAGEYARAYRSDLTTIQIVHNTRCHDDRHQATSRHGNVEAVDSNGGPQSDAIDTTGYIPAQDTVSNIRPGPVVAVDNDAQLRGNGRQGDRGRLMERGRESKCACGKCCMRCVYHVTSLRVIFFVLSMVGACSVIAGISLGSADSTGSLLTSFTLIGAGGLFVLVVAMLWKCSTPHCEPCHALLGISHVTVYPVNRQQTTTHRRWFGGVLYPEFTYVTPPPSYAVTMRSYVVHGDVTNNNGGQQCAAETAPSDSCRPTPHTASCGGDGGDGGPLTVSCSSPPPSYHSTNDVVVTSSHSQPPRYQSPSSPSL